ncbi:hypothetical protein [Paraburkholderia sp. MM5384-R2]|uniref:hypothetical protein n=1 Tax=Paraburkholderia sp. MM5384-R2 TaxID=2723097 RepID=UPI00160BD095|nr:hypothetical protein [Paraburkholderia sp. MM5384-R2]MBB5499326.1 hypothetical protein [Paraburkholderia sp. MM5384-R2]
MASIIRSPSALEISEQYVSEKYETPNGGLNLLVDRHWCRLLTGKVLPPAHAGWIDADAFPLHHTTGLAPVFSPTTLADDVLL